MLVQRLKLLKHLPGCPKGRYFLQDIGGDWFHSMSDKEAIAGKLQDYKLDKRTVLENPKWFKKVSSKNI